MKPYDALVSVGLPVRNGAARIRDVVKSVLAQDHGHLELVICDNASTDATEAICRDLVRTDSRIVYHRHPENVGLTNNFVSAIQIAKGTYFRWIGDDDWLAPDFVSHALKCFDEDERRLIVTTGIAYTDENGATRSDRNYDGAGMASLDPIERLREFLRLLNESYLLVDPLYAMVRREPVAAIPRRNMLREDEIFATKMALAGPWGHVPLILAGRNTRIERMSKQAKRLQVPTWQAHMATTLECREILGWISQSELTQDQKREARAAVRRMYLNRQAKTVMHRVRKLGRMASARRRSAQTASFGQ
jgi:cellulose synthase/poly-beta-1,6-N-acetylglucosamine synthase-like glycosyltransferase